ncbi:MAG: sugar transferase [Anaerolineae bacterium]|nr:sugar transferase [Anaerolineales bacterium]MCQ3976726.1 sugar transferase [Anaerolineae bacterium]
MVLLGFWLAYAIRFQIGFVWFYRHEVVPTDFYQNLVFLIAPAWIIVFRLFGLYDFKNLFAGTREYAKSFNASTFAMMLMILFIFFGETNIARAWVLLSWLLVSLGVIIGRFVLRRIVQNLRANGRFLTAALIIGANEEGLAIAEQLQANPKAGVWLAGFADDELGPGSELLPNVPVLGSVDTLSSLVRQHGIQEIIVASTALPREKLLQLFTAFGSEDNITIRMSSGIYELLTTGVEVQEFGNVPLLSVNKVRLTGVDMTMKSMLDLTLSIISLLVFLPIMLAIAIAIRLDSPGPIFHLRRVVGVGGKGFNAFKFRTMYVDADERLSRDPELRREFEMNHKLKNDPRVTRIGRFLRRTSLDELPQLINVLLGQMSLVGPRMITAEERARYGKFRMNLSTVKPGITGLWQVSGRSDVSYEERVMLDMNYIRNYSIWFDLFILWQTIPAVLKSRGAY